MGETRGDEDVIIALGDKLKSFSTLLLCAVIVCVFQFLDKLGQSHSPLSLTELQWGHCSLGHTCPGKLRGDHLGPFARFPVSTWRGCAQG